MIPAFLFFPPEINSALMYGGAGPGPLLAAASAWDGLAAELSGAASSFHSVVSELAAGAWTGPSSESMAAAALPYVQWLIAAAGQAEAAGEQARAAATAFEAALAATVPTPEVLANRIRLIALIATNFFGQNTPAIAMTELEYLEMWAQDVAAMVGYHAGAQSVASVLPTFSVPPTGLAGLAGLVTTPLADLASQALGAVSSAGSAFVSELQSVVTAFAPALSSMSSLLSSTPVTTMSAMAQVGMYPATALMSPMMMLAQSAGPAAPAVAGVTTVAGAGPSSVGASQGLQSSGGLGLATAGLGTARFVGAITVPPTWQGSMPVPAVMTSLALPALGSQLPTPVATPGSAGSAGSAGSTGATPAVPMAVDDKKSEDGKPSGTGRRGGENPHVVQSRPKVVPRAKRG